MARHFFGSSFLARKRSVKQRMGRASRSLESLERRDLLYSAPTGGWDYLYTGDQAIFSNNSFASLDGTWDHNNASDNWDGTGPGVGKPGGAGVFSEGSNSFLRMQDTSDPSDYGVGNPDNDRISFAHNISAEGASSTILDDGVTLAMRLRLATAATGPIDPWNRNGGAGVENWAIEGFGYEVYEGGEGFGLHQASGGQIGFHLNYADPENSTNWQVTGLGMNGRNGTSPTADVQPQHGVQNVYAIADPTIWHDFWITIVGDTSGGGTHRVTIYADDSLVGQTFHVTAGTGSDYANMSYMMLYMGGVSLTGGDDIDFMGYKAGVHSPSLPSAPEVDVVAATNVAAYSATIGGASTADAAMTLYYGLVDGGTSAANWQFSASLGSVVAGANTQSVSGLTPNTTYFYRAFGSNDLGSDWSEAGSFSTTAATINGESDWTYIYTGDQAIFSNDPFSSLDGTWDHNNVSDNWDGAGPGVGNPGGAGVFAEGSNSFLRMQDTSDPSDYGVGNPDNDRMSFGHNISAEGASDTILDDGVTLAMRLRLATAATGPVDPWNRNGGAGIEPWPAEGFGYEVRDSGKGIGIRQASGSQIGFHLNYAEPGNLNNWQVTGLGMNSRNGTTPTFDVQPEDGVQNVFAIDDPTVWHDFWVTIVGDTSGGGTHRVTIYSEGDLVGQVFHITAGTGVAEYAAMSYMTLDMGGVSLTGGDDIDYFGWRPGVHPPTSSTSPFESIMLSASPANGEKLAVAPTTATVIFSEEYDGGSVLPTDLLVDGSMPATAVELISPQSLRFTLPAGLSVGTHTLSIASGAIGSTSGATFVPLSSSFTIVGAPSAANVAATNIDGVSAVIGGQVVSTGFDEPIVTLYWGDNDGGTNEGAWDNVVELGRHDVGQYSSLISGLSGQTQYFYRTRLTNLAGATWAPSTASFSTLQVVAPSIENDPASPVGVFAASVHGEVVATGNEPPTVTIFYGTTNGGTVAGNWQSSIELGPQSGSFSALLSGISSSTIYFYTSRAVNSAGTTWAIPSESFTTGESAGIVINEVVARNGVSLTTRTRPTIGVVYAGNQTTPDWIEIFNRNDASIDLGGKYLTDSAGNLTKWQFPAGTTIPASGYLIVYASGLNVVDPILDETGRLHTNFSIDGDGEYLALVDSNGSTILHEYTPSIPDQRIDVSYGLDGFGLPTYFQTPTPGAENDDSSIASGLVGDTHFSIDRGFFTDSFDTAITVDTPGATIVYTIDGSEPTLSSGVQVPAPNFFTPPTAIVNITTTTTLRARAYLAGLVESNVDTQTYIFLEDVIHQNPSTQSNGGIYPTNWQPYGSSGTQAGDYAMDPSIVAQWDDDNPLNADFGIRASLQSLPTLSIVMDFDDLWGESNGIYNHSLEDGDAWQRAGSVEYFDPATGESFQVNAGVEIHGVVSRRNPYTKKHSLRLTFKEEYGGPPSLDFPLFGDSGPSSFNSVVLRAFFTDSFAARIALDYSPIDSLYMRDVWMRETAGAMGHETSRSNYVQLYINGLYWGLYNPAERLDDKFFADHLGGNAEDYDVIKDFNAVFSGNNAAWYNMFDLVRSINAGNADDVYFALQGKNPDGTANPANPTYLDVDSLIDNMLLHFYAGAEDWPFHNWYAARNRVEPGTGFQFFVWDQEGVIEGFYRNLTGVGVVTDPSNQTPTRANPSYTPAEIYHRLLESEEFRLRFADRAQLHLLNGGALSVEASQARLTELANWIEPAIVAESARWGDAHEGDMGQIEVGGPVLTVPKMTIDRWRESLDFVLNTYFPEIAGGSAKYVSIFEQLAGVGLFSTTVGAPMLLVDGLGQHGGAVNQGSLLTLASAGGTSPVIFYTTDGTDPRAIGGAAVGTVYTPGVSPPIALSESTAIKARVLAGGTWSALTDTIFTVEVPLRVAELMYHPHSGDGATEFIELTNTGAATINLVGITINGLGNYQFLETDAITTLAPGASIVIVENLAAFAARYPAVPASAIASRPYSGGLDNNGETLTIFDAAGGVIQSFRYDDKTSEGWYDETDGDGYSLVPISTDGDYNDPLNWRASAAIGGSPGEQDPEPLAGDFNGSGTVDRRDLALLIRGFGRSTGAVRTDGDANRDGAVTLADLALTQSTFTGPLAPSPEPLAADAALESSTRPLHRLTAERRTVRRPTAIAIDLAHSAMDQGAIETASSLQTFRSLRARRWAVRN